MLTQLPREVLEMILNYLGPAEIENLARAHAHNDEFLMVLFWYSQARFNQGNDQIAWLGVQATILELLQNILHNLQSRRGARPVKR